MRNENVNNSTNFDKSVNSELTVSELTCEATATCDDFKSREKIKTSFAQIIVRKIKEKPYFEILYFDNQDKRFHVGFGSSCLEYVFQWLSEEFEIIEAVDDIMPVIHGQWIDKHNKIECSICSHKVFLGTSDKVAHKEEKENRKFCTNCGAKMDIGDDSAG